MAKKKNTMSTKSHPMTDKQTEDTANEIAAAFNPASTQQQPAPGATSGVMPQSIQGLINAPNIITFLNGVKPWVLRMITTELSKLSGSPAGEEKVRQWVADELNRLTGQANNNAAPQHSEPIAPEGL